LVDEGSDERLIRALYPITLNPKAMLQIIAPLIVVIVGYLILTLSAKLDPYDRDQGGMK
jgi:hypothetical protein